jgi:hypothetical protein
VKLVVITTEAEEEEPSGRAEEEEAEVADPSPWSRQEEAAAEVAAEVAEPSPSAEEEAVAAGSSRRAEEEEGAEGRCSAERSAPGSLVPQYRSGFPLSGTDRRAPRDRSRNRADREP